MTLAHDDAAAWGLPSVVQFFEAHRNTSQDVYPSERVFLEPSVREGIDVLDVGCALGGFADILSEKLAAFTYTGLDVNEAMIVRARQRHPRAVFHHVDEADFSILGERQFDLVLVLGILHLHEAWRDTLQGAWRHTKGQLIFDLRQIPGASVEDRNRSYMMMDFGGEQSASATRVPYNLINSGDALDCVLASCPDARKIEQYGYIHAVSASAITPVRTVMTTSWCIHR